MKSQTGFTLIELMTVVGVIGTLASIAIPAYGDYLARAQLAEAVRLVSSAKGVATEHYVNTGAWPESLTDLPAPARYTQSIALTEGAGLDEPSATLTVIVASSGVQADIRGKAIELRTADGGATWSCRSGSIAQRHLPSGCRT